MSTQNAVAAAAIFVFLSTATLRVSAQAPTQITFEKAEHSQTLNETMAVGLYLTTVKISGPVGSSCPCNIQILSTNINSLTAIIRNKQDKTQPIPITTADIFTQTNLDYEQADPNKVSGGSVSWTLTIEGHSTSKPSQSATTLITVTILDLNDNSPTFSPTTATTAVPENMPIDSTVLTISVTDKDAAQNGQFSVNFRDQSMEQIFSIFYVSDGILIMNRKVLDREDVSLYSFVLEAVDMGDTPRTGSALVNITILDENDHTPRFTQSDIKLVANENSPVGMTLYSLTATDEDSGENRRVTYELVEGTTDGLFVVTSDGNIKVARHFNYENVTRFVYEFSVEARDNGMPPRSSNVTVVVSIANVNEHNPRFHHDDLVWWIPEDTPTGYRVGRVEATDMDTVDRNRLVYFINKPGLMPFRVDNKTGEIFTTRSDFDYELGPRVYTLNVYVTDGGLPTSRESNIQVNVTITDSNEFSPIFSQSQYVETIDLRVAHLSSVVARVRATDGDGGMYGVIHYSLSESSSFFQVNSASGDVILINSSLTVGVSENISMIAFDLDGRNSSVTITFNVIISPTTWSSTHTPSTLTQTVAPTLEATEGKETSLPVITTTRLGMSVGSTSQMRSMAMTKEAAATASSTQKEGESSHSCNLIASTGFLVVSIVSLLLL
ncbi:protocadherin-11 Y-linked-like isoform X2 [Corticium candelabrum]|uniref:protocadherin-11 Y-linked-like isoform X2 n=1 Tax=Corticium candelabrum TaxID=121492 RepID=UPI002E264FED|nr:protocadherin-11 Y-linked-like isoform X2 [Corticium candelabrum]